MEESSIPVSSLPYTDTQASQSFGYYEANNNGWNGMGGQAVGGLAIHINLVQNYQHLHYAQLETTGATVNIGTEGDFSVWYKRPSDNTYQKGLLRNQKTRNVLGQVTKTVITFWPLDGWAVGTKMGVWDSAIYADDNGVPGNQMYQTSLTYYLHTDHPKISGDDRYGGYMYFTRSSPNYNSHNTRSHVEAYSNEYYALKIEDAYASAKITLTRKKDGINYPSSIIISDSSGVTIFSDTQSVDISSIVAKNRIKTITVTIGSKNTTYNLYLDGILPPPALYGNVVNVYTQVPIEGATITATQSTIGKTLIATSNANGEYTIGNAINGLVPDYPVTITASAAGYNNATLSFQAVPRYTSWYILIPMIPTSAPDVPSEPDKSMLYGYIMTQGNQQPITGATVSLDGYGSTTTSSTGFYLFNNVTPGSYSISASASLHDTLTEPVTVDSAPTPYNLALKGHFLLTVSTKDSESLTTLHNATISLNDGQESTQNPATFNVDYGPYTITAAAGGYYPQTQSAYLDRPGTTTATILLTERPPPATPAEMPNYPQHNVRFLCVDEYNHPLQNVTITAVYQESSGPVSWITDWLGLSQNVHVANSTLQGTTGLDGSVIFLMVQSVQYRMTVAAPAPLNMTKTFDLYPKEDQITIRFVTSDRPDLSTMPTYELTATETDPSSVRLALSYHDATNATTALTFTVTDHATGELIHTETFAASKFPGTVSPSYTVENTKGAMYRFGFEATNTVHGPISQYKGITLNGDGLLVDLGFEDRNLYAWLAVILMFLFAGAFSGTNVKQGAILVPLFGGGLFWFIGWLPITIGGVISAIGFLGVLVYMRKSEWKVRA